MVLEWLRRHDAAIDEALRDYLFAEGSIVGREEATTGGDKPGPGLADRGGGGGTGGASDGSLGIGSLRGRS
jgi:hypothetical protein